MTIVCGIDFSPASSYACEVAALLAQEHDEPLLLVHAISAVAVPPAYLNGTLLDSMRDSAESALQEMATRLGGEARLITARTAIGAPDQVLLELAEQESVRLIVLASIGHHGMKWLLGSTADRVAARSHVPVLVVRPDFPAEAWLRKERPLRVALAAELGPSTDAAIEWATHLPQHGECEFVVTHLSWPPEEYDRLAIDAPMHLDRTHPLVAEVLRRELTAAASRLERVGRTEIVVESNMGSTAAAIAQVASRERADLLIVGRGSEEGRSWWDQSVSRAVIRQAPTSVVCVPEIAREMPLPEPKVRKILVATDCSRLGNASLAHAASIAPAGGEILLVHVLENGDQAEAQRAQRQEQLERLAKAVATDAKIRVELLIGEDPAHLITAAAERFDADVICIGSRGRSGLAKALLGSVSQGVLLRSTRPVMVIPSPAHHF